MSDQSINPYNKKMFLVGTGATIGIFITEHVGRYYEIIHRPSTLINFLANKSSSLFKTIGQVIANLSSFLTRIDIDDLLVTVKSIINPIIQLIGSPWNFMTGYFETAIAYVGKSFSVYLGSGMLILLIGYLIHRFIPRFRQIPQKIFEYIQKPKVLITGTGIAITSLICYLFHILSQSGYLK